MPSDRFDVVVIGSGPGGEGAAQVCARAGRRVAVVERHAAVGGGCTHWATIPSKALRHLIRQFTEARTHPLFAPHLRNARVSFPEIVRAAEVTIARQVASRTDFYFRLGVEVIEGHGRLDGPSAVRVSLPDGSERRLEAGAVVLAAGSRPYRPAGLEFAPPRVVDSDTILSLPDTPRSAAVFGAGVIGCEYASMLALLGVRVTLVDTRDRLLSFLDDEITDALRTHLRELGVEVIHHEPEFTLEPAREGVSLRLASGRIVRADTLLYAAGRTGNTSDLGLETAGIEADGRGRIATGGCYETCRPGVYAVGDLTGHPCLAGAAHDQGRIAGTHIVHRACELKLADRIPAGIYTIPEISCVGRTERALREEGIPYAVGVARFADLARAHITGHTTGLLKLLFNRDTLELLGVHAFGEGAAEILHIGLAVMGCRGGNTIRAFVVQTFNYPTMAEAYRTAALDGLEKCGIR